MAYRRNTNLRDILGQKTILNGKVKRSTPIHERKGWCSPCNSRNFNLCCQQMRNTNTFKSNMTKQEFKIYHHVMCNSKFIIYLLECILCGMAVEHKVKQTQKRCVPRGSNPHMSTL